MPKAKPVHGQKQDYHFKIDNQEVRGQMPAWEYVGIADRGFGPVAILRYLEKQTEIRITEIKQVSFTCYGRKTLIERIRNLEAQSLDTKAERKLLKRVNRAIQQAKRGHRYPPFHAAEIADNPALASNYAFAERFYNQHPIERDPDMGPSLIREVRGLPIYESEVNE